MKGFAHGLVSAAGSQPEQDVARGISAKVLEAPLKAQGIDYTLNQRSYFLASSP